ncbi:hypothetical protein [Mediterraneibacter glycyrrhizinilyticus]|uniref:hypothetical protein n=1 Tax=Mediterraneibacter glycyrrhizinilyticus TaxID=342942 RepID=UPI0025AB0A7F|nr:hypothetical protein [Mediterraneibacter glycyrrhizinilyticus]MDN0044216.1 hypothetical protein [Mediterraneibacter glycyrrhizinilyticus]
MKRWISCIIAGVLMCCCLAGCSGDSEEKEATEESVKPLVIDSETYGSLYENLPDSDVSYTEEEIDDITQGINDWAGSTLLVDSSLDEETRDLIDQSLYESIVSQDDLEKVKSDRESFYGDEAKVTISQTETAVASATVTRYNNKDLGRVRCETRISGTRNGEPFTRSYQMILVISYNEGVTAVYEIGKIEWEDLEQN